MPLTANTRLKYDDLDYSFHPMAASVTIYMGAAVGRNSSTGLARPLVAGDQLLGFADTDSEVNGSTAGATLIKVRHRGLVELPITSVAQGDCGKPVWATDDGTFVITSETDGSFIGHIVRLSDRSGYAWVRYEHFVRPVAKFTAANVNNTVTSVAEAKTAIDALAVIVNTMQTALERTASCIPN